MAQRDREAVLARFVTALSPAGEQLLRALPETAGAGGTTDAPTGRTRRTAAADTERRRPAAAGTRPPACTVVGLAAWGAAGRRVIRRP